MSASRINQEIAERRVTYYDVLRWVYNSLPTTKTVIRWRLAYFYAGRFNPKDYEFILNVYNSYRARNSQYVAFRKTFNYFAGSFEDKEAGQSLKSHYFRDSDYCTYRY